MTPRRRGLRPVPAPARLADVHAGSSDALLDAAAPGLDRLDAALPRRAALAAAAGLPPPPDGGAGLRRRLDRLRGVDLEGLGARAEDLRHVAGVLRERHRAVAQDAGALWESWSGPGADDVAGRVVDLARAAHGVVTVLEETAERIERAAVSAADAVAGLATAARGLADAPELPATAGPDVVLGPDARRAVRAAAADLDARLHRVLALAEGTEAVLAAQWSDLAAATAALRALPVARPPDPTGDPDATAPHAERSDPLLEELLAGLVLPLPSAVDPAAPRGDDPGTRGPHGPRAPQDPPRPR